MKKAIWYVLMGLTIPLVSCEKDKVEYGPEEIRQFGTESARVQELSFPSDDFTIVGDLRMPMEGGPHPVILMIHGSGGATRNGAVPFTPMIEIFLRNGFAVLSWDKPGTGESKGSFDSERTIFQRADILTDAIEVLAENSSLDLSVVGLWGLSQAGWVMPLALENSSRISFMIVVSGGGEDGIEQGAYQVAQRIACIGGSPEDVQTLEQYWAIMNKAEVYLTYREAAEIILEIPGVYEETGLVISEEEDWNPWPRDIGAFFDPRDVLRETTIPVLAFFGELDKYVDPVQGAQAYETSLEAAGNPDYLVVSIQGAGHVMVEVETGCPGEFVGNVYMSEYLETLESWLMDR